MIDDARKSRNERRHSSALPIVFRPQFEPFSADLRPDMVLGRGSAADLWWIYEKSGASSGREPSPRQHGSAAENTFPTAHSKTRDSRRRKTSSGRRAFLALHRIEKGRRTAAGQR